MQPDSSFFSTKMAASMTISLLILLWMSKPLYVEADEIVQAYDVVLTNGMIIDGSGSKAYRGDIGLVDGRIKNIGKLNSWTAREHIDIEGLVVAPGFIDAHSHAEEGLVNPDLKSNKGFITQGVTTTIFGVDGGYSLDAILDIRQTLNQQGVGTNYMFYIGHNGLRKEFLGMAERSATQLELEHMQETVRQAMEQGMLGLSSGLMYLPGRNADTSELINLAKVSSDYGGLYDSHIRDPAHNLIESIVECLDIAQAAGVDAHPAHLKVVGQHNFGLSREIVDIINSRIERGFNITSDIYPYDGAAARKLVAILVPPAEAAIWDSYHQLENGSLSEDERRQLVQYITGYLQQSLKLPALRQQIKTMTEQPPAGIFSWVDAVGYGSFRIVVSKNPDYVGRMLIDLAKEQGKSPFDVIADLILTEGDHAKITLGAVQESELRYFLQQPWVMIASDGKITGMANDAGHPRYRGTFPRVLGRYVRLWGILSLEEAVRKMTSLPARYLKLSDRGLLKVGNWADITVFDPDTIIDNASWEHPSLYSEGVVHVLINGGFAMRDGRITDQTFGRFLPFEGRPH